MAPTYTYTKSADYINNLDFDYIETYSFQRGNEYEEYIQQLKEEYSRLQARKKRSKAFTAKDEERYDELQKLVSVNQYLVDKEGNFHASSKKINTFHNGHPAIQAIRQLMQTEIVEVLRTLCAPYHRDAIVFYNKQGKIVSVLNICFSCFYMQTGMFDYVDTDYMTFLELKKLFIEIGHKVEK